MAAWAPRALRHPFVPGHPGSWRENRRSRTVAAAAALAVALLVGAPVASTQGVPHWPHIRSADRQVLEFLRQGCRRSPTFKRFFDEIERSDLIVYVEATKEVPKGVEAYLQLAGANSKVRFLRIVLRIPASSETLISQLGHELEHATEIAGAPEVRDQAGLDAFYRRIGDDSGKGWDTPGARSAGNIVLDELRHAASAPANAVPADDAQMKVARKQ